MMKEEVWKPIKDYEGLYEISNLGRVKSLNYKRTGKEKILKNTVCNDGYLKVGLTKNGKIKYLEFIDLWQKPLYLILKINHL